MLWRVHELLAFAARATCRMSASEAILSHEHLIFQKSPGIKYRSVDRVRRIERLVTGFSKFQERFCCHSIERTGIAASKVPYVQHPRAPGLGLFLKG